MSQSPEPVPCEPCEELWFEDGSVILRTCPKIFRVYRGLLSAHSLVFRDLFAIPQPEDAETMGDIPVVDLPDDPEDLTYFLRALIDSCYYDDNIREFRIVSAILRLSTKYDINRLRERAIAQLLTAYPTTLQEFNYLQRNPTVSRIQAFDGIEIAVVNLGEEIDIPQILPSAYYNLIFQQNNHVLLDGVVDPFSPNSGREILGQRAALRCAIGRDVVRRVMMQVTFGPNTEACRYNDSTCNHRRLLISEAIDDGLLARTVGPFHGVKLNVSGLCSGCQVYIRGDSSAVLQMEAWERLPEWFELPSWDRLLSTGE